MNRTHLNPSRSSVPVLANRTRFHLGRVLDRRRASRELDRLLGVDSRPDLAVTYGLTLAGESR